MGLRSSITLIKMEDPSPCQSNQHVDISEVYCKYMMAATELNLRLSDISWVLSCVTLLLKQWLEMLIEDSITFHLHAFIVQ